MKVTGIRQQQKRADRYSIYVDESYAFSLSEAALLRSGIVRGQELNPTEIDDYRRLSDEDKLYNRALNYVAMRPHSVWEVRFYLQRKDASEAAIDAIINKLVDLHLLDDVSFAANFVQNRQLLRPTSRRKLELELKKKHIASHHAQLALDSLESTDDDSIQAVITKLRRQSKYQDNTKLMQHLARQGYGYGVIKSALQADQEAY